LRWAASAKQTLEKIEGALRSGWNSTRDSRLLRDFAARVGFRFHIGGSIVARHLHVRALACVGAFFVLAADIASGIAH
jgi:hypothetical protein